MEEFFDNDYTRVGPYLHSILRLLSRFSSSSFAFCSFSKFFSQVVAPTDMPAESAAAARRIAEAAIRSFTGAGIFGVRMAWNEWIENEWNASGMDGECVG